ncbi:hypothetical protein Tco_0312233 [Tanacetum coccineum]
MMDADYQMAQQLQAEEQEQLSIEEKLKLFVQLLEAKKKHFVEMKAREKRNKPPTQAQQRKLYYTKIAEHSYNKKVDKKQKIDDSKVDDDQEEARMKELLNIVSDEEEVEINAIPLATKPPWYSSMIQMLKDFDREDLETLWKLVKAKHGSTRPEDGYARVLWGDLMTMFKPDVESPVWRTLQNEKVLIWKLFDSCRVHFLRLKSMHLFMLVEKRYPLTPATITKMLNKKLQIDHLNEMCYQLLNLMTKQLKKQIKSFIRLFGIIAALIKVSDAQEERTPLIIATSHKYPDNIHYTTPSLLWNSSHDEWHTKNHTTSDPSMPTTPKDDTDPFPQGYPKRVFNNEVEQLSNEYILRIGKKGYVLDDVWEKYEQNHRRTTYAWHDEGRKEEELWKSGIEKTEFEPPMVLTANKLNLRGNKVAQEALDGNSSFTAII